MQQDAKPQACDVDSNVIRYGAREIDFTRYVGIGDAVIRSMANPENHDLYWIRWGFDGALVVRATESGRRWTEENEEVVLELGMRSFWSPSYHVPSRSFFFLSDENNDETFNVYCFSPGMREVSQVTNVGYAGGYAFPPQTNKLVFLGRPKKTGLDTSLFELDLDSLGEVSALHEDDDRFRIWPYSSPVIDADNERIAFVLKQDNRRNRKNLAIYSRRTGETRVVTDAGIGRNMLETLAWVGNQVLLISDEGTEKQSLYGFDASSGKLSVIMENPLQTADGVYDPVTRRALVEFRDGAVGEVVLVDVATGEAVARQASSRYDLWWSLCHPLGNGEFAISTKIRGERDALVCRLALAPPQDAEILSVGFEPSINQLQAAPCEMEDVTYPTFDLDDSGEVRQIEAVLFMPNRLADDPEERAAIVWAHGGPSGRTTKSWHVNIQLLVAMGYIVLGANPRGSIGQGKRFEDLNNDDWGGGDYQDYEYGLRYLMDRFEIPNQRIGIAGFSYGGYMTNWAVTRPNGLFGFGISLGGISDLAISIEESVVATNTISELGDIDDNAKLYRDRSPINWSHHMDVPLLLIHGARDNRTSTNQSRVFYAKLKQLGKDVELVEIAGEGHGFHALKSQKTCFQRQADFLRRVAPISHD